MSWFSRPKSKVKPLPEAQSERVVRTEGLWFKCEECNEILWKKVLEENLSVCPKCGHHYQVSARRRIELLLDEGWQERDAGLVSNDPLHFSDSKTYKSRLRNMQEKTGIRDAAICASGKMHGQPVELCAMELQFIGGSMGSVVGEKLTRAAERALAGGHPLVVVSASGGARMQEGMVSLMQLAKISSMLAMLDDARIPFISILTNPTTGGVTASFAMLGDLNIGEPKALIGFAGPRVIEQTIRQKLPEGFQRAEFLLEHGFLDAVVTRQEMKRYVARSLRRLLNKPAPAPAATPEPAAPATA
ncbi:MAG: acetyl-CoA carboxylase carboxyltransferase subunit beta [Bryobacterales bacterium]|nr:acetyl-CoA carboxylase carboxyltransferase subunit beta [Bryobacterales bacterium]